MITTLEEQLCGGFHPIKLLMEDSEVTDILINGRESTYVERRGQLVRLDPLFQEDSKLYDFIERLCLPIGKRIDASQPYLDGRLLNGSRFHVVLPPIAVEGPLISIRMLQRSKAFLKPVAPPLVMEWIMEQVQRRKNILIAGGTGSGKTTLLSYLLSQVDPAERIALLEETVELQPEHPHVVHLEARPPSPDGKGEVTLRVLVKNALRMRPDRLILGECRGAEAFDLLQAMNTGHTGSMSTIHSNTALGALRRLESLVLLGGFSVPLKSVREWIGATIDVVVLLERVAGERVVRDILSLSGLEGDVYRFTPCKLLKGMRD